MKKMPEVENNLEFVNHFEFHLYSAWLKKISWDSSDKFTYN